MNTYGQRIGMACHERECRGGAGRAGEEEICAIWLGALQGLLEGETMMLTIPDLLLMFKCISGLLS
jgi:hypothetical protein